MVNTIALDEIINSLKKNVLDLMRHNNYNVAKFIINADGKSRNVEIEVEKKSKKKRAGKIIKLIEFEKI